MVEVLKHTLGLCGEGWHPNLFTAIASSPVVYSTYYYVKCKCGGLFNRHKDKCDEL